MALFEELDFIEQEAVLEALALRGVRLEPAPEGKRFGAVLIDTEPVFAPDHFFAFLNVFHATTRPRVIEEEILWRPGDDWDANLVRESQRNLRLRDTLGVVALVPVESEEPGVVDVLVVTSDTWSLRLNTDFAFAGGVLDSLLLAVVEENLLGLHKELGVSALYEQDTLQIGPTYEDPRWMHTRLTLSEDLRFVVNHSGIGGDSGLEGVLQAFELGLPLYSLDSRWGFSLAQYYESSVFRDFVGSRLRTWDDPATTQVEEAVPFAWRQTIAQVEARALYRAGQGNPNRVRHDLYFGIGTLDERYEPSAAIDEPARDAFAAAVLPRSELANYLHLTYFVFEARYRSVSRFETFGFAEDLRVGPSAELDVEVAPEALGSDTTFVEGSVSSTYRGADPDGWIGEITAGAGLRWQVDEGRTVDRFLSLAAQVATPTLGPVRFHLGGSGRLRFERFTESLVSVGGDTGFRGFPIGAFLGESDAIAHLEMRTAPLFSFLNLYFAAVVFFDAGTVFFEGGPAELLSDVGVGLRVLAPQSSRILYRVDYAFPTSGPDSFFPGSLTFGLGQAF